MKGGQKRRGCEKLLAANRCWRLDDEGEGKNGLLNVNMMKIENVSPAAVIGRSFGRAMLAPTAVSGHGQTLFFPK